MEIRLYLDIQEGTTPEGYFTAVTIPVSPKPENTRRYEIIVDVPAEAFYGELAGSGRVVLNDSNLCEENALRLAKK